MTPRRATRPGGNHDRDRETFAAARMFFTLSKIFGFFTVPSNVLIAIGLVGVVLLCTRYARLARWLMATSLVLLAVAGFSPLGNALILPLEQRFPAWDPSRGPPDGIVMLGG